MKFNKFILVGVFLLAILAVGAVSASGDVDNITASDNAQDTNIAVENNDPLADSPTDELIGDGEPTWKVSAPSTVRAMEWATVNITFPEGAVGTLLWDIDGQDSEDDTIDGQTSETIYFMFNSQGSRYLEITFESEDESTCASDSIRLDFDVTDYDIYVSADSDTCIYGDDVDLDIEFPEGAYGIATVTVNGVKKTFDLLEEDIEWRLTNVKVSQINVTVSYAGDGQYKKKTVTKSLDVYPDVTFQEYISFDEYPVVSINYIGSIPVVVELWHDDDLVSNNTVHTVNNVLNYEIPGTYLLGGEYEIYVYCRDFEKSETFDVIPDTNLKGDLWIEGHNTYYVRVPSSYAGKTLIVTVGPTTVFEEALGDNCTATFTLPAMEPDSYWIKFSIDDTCIAMYSVDLRSENPSVDLNVTMRTPIMMNEDFYVWVSEIEGSEGKFSFYIDGVLNSAESGIDETEYILSSQGIACGNHTLTVKFSGDSYYHPASKNLTFEIVDCILQVPQTVILNGGDSRNYTAYVRLPRDATDLVCFFIDGIKVMEGKYEEEWMEDDYSTYMSYDLSELDISRNHTLRIDYKGDGKYSKFTKDFNLSMDFNVRLELEEEYQYGDYNQAYLRLPPSAKPNFEIFIDGNKFTRYYMDEEGCYILNISEFGGLHEILVAYKGDGTYTARNVTASFNTEIPINCKYYAGYGLNDTIVSLKMPSDAKGNLVVRLDGESYATVPVTNGFAGVSFANLSIGEYSVSAYYDGTDYNVTAIEDYEAYVVGKVQSYLNGVLCDDLDECYYMDKISLFLMLPKNATGTLVAYVDGEKVASNAIVNGTVQIILPTLSTDDHDISAVYESDDGYNVADFDISVSVVPKLVVSTDLVVFGKNLISLKGSSDFVGRMELVVDDDWEHMYSAEFRNGVATLSLSKLTSGKHTIYIVCYDFDEQLVSDYETTINVAKAASPRITAANTVMYYMNGYFKATVYGTDGNPLKNAVVLFKVNGKNARYARTNASGVALFKMTNLPKTYKVTAQYSKVAVTKTVIIKRVLTLKNAIVKKSAKFVILQAALKKGAVPIKAKWVFFKFNGRTFKARTNSLGIAKIAVNKAFFSKLRVGQKVIYQAIYTKDTIRKVAVVRK